MKQNKKFLTDALRYGLATSMVAGLAAGQVAFAQSDEEVEELDNLEVTGSRIRRTEIEGASPVTVIEREDLELSGESNVADYLRNTTFNSFGSFRETSGNTFQSQGLVDLRGLGSERTLVLLNGRRMQRSPVTGNSANNLNVVPMEAVERIEILSDSASAIYGSDAIGGVINIILREDFQGAVLKAGGGRPTNEGMDEEWGSAIFGGEFEKGNFVFSAERFNRGILFSRDRDYLGVDPGDGQNFGSTQGISQFGNTLILLPSLDRVAAPNCPEDLYAGVYDTPQGTACTYAYADSAAQSASLQRTNTFLSVNYEITDSANLFYQNFYTHNESFGRYAPAVGSFFVTGSAPSNPIGEDLVLGHRFVLNGPRDTNFRENVSENTLGLEGYFGQYDYEVSVRNALYQSSSADEGYIIQSIAEQLVANGSYDPFNINAPGNQAAAEQMSATLTRTIESDFTSFNALIRGDLFEMPAGIAGFAAGVEYRDESFQDIYDAQRRASNIIGSSGGSAAGQRHAYAAFTEVLVPLLDTLELNVAGRYDKYSDFGSEFTPQASLRFQPMPELMFRFSWGKGFRAPTLSDLYGSQAQSFEFVRDFVQCNANGVPVSECPELQYETLFGSNPDLEAEESESMNFGVVWQPTDSLALKLDVYDVQIENIVQAIGAQTLVNLQNDGRALPSGSDVIRGSGGTIQQIIAPTVNIAERQTQGLDFRADYTYDFGSAGLLEAGFQLSHILKYEIANIPTEPLTDVVGQDLTPENRANVDLRWNYGDFTVGWNTGWIDETEDDTGEGTLDSYWVHDLTVVYRAPYDTQFTVGVRNLTDELPPLASSTGFYVTDSEQLYSNQGRVPFAQVKVSF